MMTSVIIDDEQNNIVNLQTLLQKHCSGIRIVATAVDADEGAAIIEQCQPDVVFFRHSNAR